MVRDQEVVLLYRLYRLSEWAGATPRKHRTYRFKIQFDSHTLPPHLLGLKDVVKNEPAENGNKVFDPVLESRDSAARVTTGFKIPLHRLSATTSAVVAH